MYIYYRLLIIGHFRKSLRPLNKKTSANNVEINQMHQVKLPESSRGSVPPDHRISSVQIPLRAKSVSRETNYYDIQSNTNAKSVQSLFSPSRFFSLSRRITKFRFNSQPDTTTHTDIKNYEITKPIVEKEAKKPSRERAMSPSKFFRSLRPRSPFGRARVNSVKVLPTNIDASNTDSSNIASNYNTTPTKTYDSNQKLMTMSCYSSMNADDNHISDSISQHYKDENLISSNHIGNEKLRSVSCEFIENSSALNATSQMIENALSELKPNNSNIQDDNLKSKTTNPESNKLNVIEIISADINKMISENKNESAIISNTQMPENIKTVKFKEPPEIEVQESIFTSLAPMLNRKTEEQLILALDEAISSRNCNEVKQLSPELEVKEKKSEELKIEKKTKAPPLSVTEKFNNIFRHQSYNCSTNVSQLKLAFSTNNVDKPPKPPSMFSETTQTNSSRTRFANTKSRTIDFPDLLQNAIDSANQTNKNNQSNPKMNNAGIKPLTSILRRSETPPSTKNQIRQTSIESNESNKERESSIEKRLKITSSTSRPLMFN